ncbi:MAG: nitroreductase family protein, partial [Anaerotignaceae bacterium]
NNQRSRIVVSQDTDVNLTLGRLSRDLQFKNTPMQTAYVSSEQPRIKDDLKILDGYYGAPTVLTIFVPNHNFPREDVAMIAENIMLASHFVGVGSCYIGRTEHVFKTEYGQTLRKQWGIEDNLLAIGTVILGYVDGVLPKPKPRKENRIIYV